MAKNKKKIKQQKKFWESPWVIRLVFLGILVLAAIFYANSFKGSFQFDDANLITKNAKISDIGNYSSTTFWSNVNVRPLSYFSFALNYAIHGHEIWGYHFINFLIHVINAFLVFLLARFIMQLSFERNLVNDRKANQAAIIIALIFLLHPLQTMAVTYIVQRMTSMAAMFYLLAVLLYGKGRLAYVHEGLNRKNGMLIGGAVVSGILAVMSKQTAITFPLAFLFFDLYFIRNKEDKPYKKYLFAGFSIAVIVFITVSLLGYLPRETPNITRAEYLLTQFKV
ncbi:MAG: hypothetical protein U9R60_00790, partial [Bacteroidota bacterium]|nr:hypothetical protein [Bacteroidota bacterium]